MRANVKYTTKRRGHDEKQLQGRKEREKKEEKRKKEILTLGIFHGQEH